MGGRGTSGHCLDQQFFTRIFEECNSQLGKTLLKPLLRYLLPSDQKQRSNSLDKLCDSELSGAEGEKDTAKTSARSNHQRLLAIDIFNSLVKASQKNHALLKSIASYLDLITSVLLIVLKTSDSWQQKKVKKTMSALNIFTKMSKTILADKSLNTKYASSIQKNGVKIIKGIEGECEKDKTMSNLKGKIKEIEHIIKA